MAGRSSPLCLLLLLAWAASYGGGAGSGSAYASSSSWENFPPPPVAPPHWVPHPTAQVVRALTLNPNLRTEVGKLEEKLNEKARRWWDKEGEKQYPNAVVECSGLGDDSDDVQVVHKPRGDEGEGDLRKYLEAKRDMPYDYQTLPALPFLGGQHRPTGWHELPRYYPFDRDTGDDITPLRSDPKELVSLEDLHKKLWKCCAKGQTRMALACIKAGASVNRLDYTAPYNHTAVSWACWGGFVGTLRMLVEHGGDLSVRDRFDQGLMHIAAAHGHTEVCQELFKMTDGDVYQRDMFQRLPIHTAAVNSRTRTVERLAELGCNVNAIDFRTETPLHLAAHHGHLPTAKVLVELGADPWRKNIENMMPIDVAEEEYHKKVYYYLESLQGEKCVFDRSAVCDTACGLRHPDTISEMFHRRGPYDLLNYTGPECVPWDWEEEFLREPPRPPVAKMTEKEIYDNPDRWEEAIKQDVNLFPHEEGGFKFPGEAGFQAGAVGGEPVEAGALDDETSSTSLFAERPQMDEAAWDQRLRRQHRRYARLAREEWLAEMAENGEHLAQGRAEERVCPSQQDRLLPWEKQELREREYMRKVVDVKWQAGEEAIVVKKVKEWGDGEAVGEEKGSGGQVEEARGSDELWEKRDTVIDLEHDLEHLI